MCAIVDANVAGEVFRPDASEAGAKFFNWLNSGKGILISGGRVHEELMHSSDVQRWAQQAVLAGKMKIVDGKRVTERAAQLEKTGSLESDDPHVLALAQISGARLLYSNDRKLQADFGNKTLIDNPRGKIYSTLVNSSCRASHKRLLANRNLCRPLNTGHET